MTSERWKRIEALFEAALERPRELRDAWLREACPNDADLIQEVEQLLRAHQKADGILEKPVHALATHLAGPTPVGDPTVGPYRLIKEIGRGGMGVVYQAHDPRLERFVALKLLPPYLRTNERIESRFIDEAKAASALDHPNICTIFDVGETGDGQLYIAMAYYEGQMLSQKILEGPLSLDESLHITSQIASGLECAHEAGIVHRDIKPSNIAQTRRGVIKILDFGVAKLERGESATKPGVMIGTTAYMSPEQTRGDEVDHRTDLWSLGVVLYEMLAGQRPFRGASEIAVLQAITNDLPVPIRTLRPDIPDSVAPILEGLLRKSPDERYDSAARVRDLIETLKTNPTSVVHVVAPPPAKGNLPTHLTSFIGREEESQKIRALLAATRLVTLTGPAGTGKTRLSLRSADEAAREFRNGAFFVSLSSIADPAMVPSLIAQVLGVAESPEEETLDTLVRAIRDKNLLLVLDNFEHVAGAAQSVARVLEACPHMKFLVTSRVALRLSGEHEFPVSPLELPRPDTKSDANSLRHFSAVKLFIERAEAVNSAFRFTDANARSVVELCRRLDGLPLAIELAAARTKIFSPQAMLTRLGKKLDLLKGGPRDRPARHQTLRQAIAWSYDLLSDEQQAFFRHLAVFADRFTLEAAEEVSGASTPLELDVLDGIEALVDQSLLRPEHSRDDESRFQMLETIRDFAREMLERAAELDETERAHAQHYLALAERAGPALTGPDQTQWLERLDADRNNLRAALSCAVRAQEVETGLRLGAALWRFWLIRGHYREERENLERLLESPKAKTSTNWRATALHGIGTLAHNQGDNLKARAYLEESLSIWRELGDKLGIATVLNNLGWVACELNDLATGQALSEEGLALNRELDEKRGMAVAHNNLGWVASYRGDFREARAHHERNLALRDEIGDQRGIAFTLTNLAWAELSLGDHARAHDLLKEALTINHRVNDKVLLSWALIVQSMLLLDQGEPDRAVAAIEECISLWPEAGNRSILAWSLASLGRVMYGRKQAEKAWALLNESLSTWKAVGASWGIATSLNQLGLIAHSMGKDEQAWFFVQESLKLREQIGDKRGLAETFESMATLRLDKGKWTQATRLLAKAAGLREAAGTPLPPCFQADHDTTLKRLREILGEEGFTREWSAGQSAPRDIAE
jgi:predicted ATPase/serine/threonine protein kinase